VIGITLLRWRCSGSKQGTSPPPIRPRVSAALLHSALVEDEIINFLIIKIIVLIETINDLYSLRSLNLDPAQERPSKLPFSSRLQARPRRHRFEAEGLALSLWTLRRLAQGEAPRRACGDAGGGRGLGNFSHWGILDALKIS
jgi:hypothetical protein